jgi:hypothetical protein
MLVSYGVVEIDKHMERPQLGSIGAWSLQNAYRYVRMQLIDSYFVPVGTFIWEPIPRKKWKVTAQAHLR